MNQKDTLRKITYALSISAVLILAFILRMDTFSLPHYRGDQHHYVALAYKLDVLGMPGYTLRGVDIYTRRDQPDLVRLALTAEKGSVLEGLEAADVTYYDQPLHHIPFGFPAALMISHRIFAPGEPYYLVKSTEFDNIISTAPGSKNLKEVRIDPLVLEKQFYSVIVPLASSLFLILLVYFLGNALYGNRVVSLMAAYLMAISPVNILTAQKLWADDLTATLALLAVILYLKAAKENHLFTAFLGGLACGFAAITKQNGAFVLIVIALWHYASNFKDIFARKSAVKTLFFPPLVVFALGAVAGSGYWFYSIHATYGSPIYMPHQPGIATSALTDWFRTVGRRPWNVYLVGIPYQNPLFLLSYIAPIWIMFDRDKIKSSLLNILWIAVFLYIFQVHLGRGGKEHRYMLPAYPAFAVLSSYIANKIRVFLDRKLFRWAGTALIIVTLAALAFWQIPIAQNSLFSGGALIRVPF
jgi:hypothetical protein